ncbi:uncharacterized protein PHACADRAFT_264971, partial [Phanerochaete carnosa HHB-10118-sp]
AITFRKTLSYSTTFSSRVFVSEINEAVYRYTQQQYDSSMSFNFERKAFEILGAVASQENTTTTEFDTALRYLKEHTIEVVETKSQSTEQIYTVGPRSKLNLYRKVFNFAGLDHECDAMKTSSKVLRETEVVDVMVKARPVAFVRDIQVGLSLRGPIQVRSCVVGLQVVYGNVAAERPDMRVVEVNGGNDDINAGFGGDYVWLKPVYTFDPVEAASRFDLIIQGGGYLDWPDL